MTARVQTGYMTPTQSGGTGSGARARLVSGGWALAAPIAVVAVFALGSRLMTAAGAAPAGVTPSPAQTLAPLTAAEIDEMRLRDARKALDDWAGELAATGGVAHISPMEIQRVRKAYDELLAERAAAGRRSERPWNATEAGKTAEAGRG